MEHRGRLLYLLRHAKAEAYSAENDFSRALTPAGKSHASALGNTMNQMTILPDVVITSAAKRAVDTAVIVCKEMGVDISALRVFDALYLADKTDYLNIIRSVAPESNRILVIGHNPSLEMLVTLLAKVSPAKHGAAITMHPATLYCLNVNTTWSELASQSCEIEFHLDGKKL